MNNYSAWNIHIDDLQKNESLESKIKFFIKFGILAANIHNTQPWRFEIESGFLNIVPDWDRQLDEIDPTGKNLYISLGCFVGNVEVIAAYHGYLVTLKIIENESVQVNFRKGSDKRLGELAKYITKRYSNRTAYDSRPIEKRKVKAFEKVKVGKVSAKFNDHRKDISELGKAYKKAVVKLSTEGGIVKELVSWLRVNDTDKHDGMPMFIQGFSKGQSKVMKRLMPLFPARMGANIVASEDKKKIANSPLVGVLVGDGEEVSDWLNVGRAYQQLSLTCFSQGVFITPMHSVVQVKETSKKVSKAFGLGKNKPQMFFRLGYASNADYHTPRRPVDWLINTEDELIRSLGLKIKKGKLKINGFDINFIKVGSGKPLVLVHGGNIGWGQWYPNLEALSGKYTIYAMDMPGGGRSSRVDFSEMDFDSDYAEVLDKFIAEMKLRKPDIVAASIGGWAAMKLAIKGKVGKLVVADAVGFTNHKGLIEYVMGFYPLGRLLSKTLFKAERDNLAIETLIRSTFKNPGLLLDRDFINYFYETTETSHNLLFISRMIQDMKQLYLGNELNKIENETLIIWGENDTSLPLKWSEPNFSKIQNSKVKILKDGGHIVSIEKSDEFNKTVLDFLK